MNASRRSEEHTSELQSHSEISYAVFCLKKKKPRTMSWPTSRLSEKDWLTSSVIGIGQSVPFARRMSSSSFLFFNDTATPEIYTNLNTLSLHDALPILPSAISNKLSLETALAIKPPNRVRSEEHTSELQSHSEISYAVFCLKQKRLQRRPAPPRPGHPRLDHGHRARGRDRDRRDRPRRVFFFFNNTATTEIYTNLNTLSLHDALPI